MKTVQGVTFRNTIIMMIALRLWLAGVYPLLCLLVIAAEFTLIESAKVARVVNCVFWTVSTWGIVLAAAYERAYWTATIATIGGVLGGIRILRALKDLPEVRR